jgi:hypothetical protein
MTRQTLLALIFVDISCRGASSSDDYDVPDADRGIPKRGAGESGERAAPPLASSGINRGGEISNLILIDRLWWCEATAPKGCRWQSILVSRPSAYFSTLYGAVQRANRRVTRTPRFRVATNARAGGPAALTASRYRQLSCEARTLCLRSQSL